MNPQDDPYIDTAIIVLTPNHPANRADLRDDAMLDDPTRRWRSI